MMINLVENWPSALDNWKTKVNKLEIYKSATVRGDLKKLSDIVKTEHVKKSAYDQLVKKVNH